MQKHKRVRSSVKWAELPDCEGESGEIELSEELENATVANCKLRDADYYDEEEEEDPESNIPDPADADMSYEDMWS